MFIRLKGDIEVNTKHSEKCGNHRIRYGNGRIGRLIIPLYLLDKHMLSKPCFYISDFFEKHRTEYYDALNRVRLKNDLIGWVKFFLRAVIETAKSAKLKFKRVTIYVKETEKRRH